jgi:hypothetical protein
MPVAAEESDYELLEMVPTVAKEILSEICSRELPGLTIPRFRALAFIGVRLCPKVIV